MSWGHINLHMVVCTRKASGTESTGVMFHHIRGIQESFLCVKRGDFLSQTNEVVVCLAQMNFGKLADDYNTIDGVIESWFSANTLQVYDFRLHGLSMSCPRSGTADLVTGEGLTTQGWNLY